MSFNKHIDLNLTKIYYYISNVVMRNREIKMIFRKKSKTYYVGERKKDKRNREIPKSLFVVLIFIISYTGSKGSQCLLNDFFKDNFHNSIYINVYGAVIDCIIFLFVLF